MRDDNDDVNLKKTKDFANVPKMKVMNFFYS